MYSKRIRGFLTLAALLVVSSCATLPTGPSVLVLPAPGKPLGVFQAEEMTCRQWAGQQIGMSAQDVANQNTATGAVVGTAVGAGAGALIGAASGNAGAGAAIGAGVGAGAGTAVVLTSHGPQIRLLRGARLSLQLEQAVEVRVPVIRS